VNSAQSLRALGVVDAAVPGRVPDAFFDLPFLVYRRDPRWIPEEPALLAQMMSSANPWFTGRAAHLFVVPNHARAAAFFDPSFAPEGEPAACFGFFETTGDLHATRLVMNEVRHWARARGAKRLYGPVNFTTFHGYRALVSAERGALPFPGEPYNPPSYPALLGTLGFSAVVLYVSQLTPFPHERMKEKRLVRDKCLADGYRVETLTAELWLDHLPEFHAISDLIFRDNFGYTSITFEQFAAACGADFAARFCSHSSTIAFAPDGSVAGCFLVYPHYGPLAAQGAGPDRVPASRLRYTSHLPLLRESGAMTAIAKTVGVLPAHQRRGVMAALTVGMFERGRSLYDAWIPALIRDDNPSRRFIVQPIGERRYALYGEQLVDD